MLSTGAAYECAASSSVANRAMKGFISNFLNSGIVLGTAYCTQKTGCRLLFKAFPPAVPILRESKAKWRQQIQRQGMAYRRHTHSLGCCPPASWQAIRKALTPALSQGRGRRWPPCHSSPHQPHSITHQKQPAPHSCTESEKAACTLKNQVQAAFLSANHRQAVIPP